MKNGFQEIALSALVPSVINPRKNFAVDDLLPSVKQKGVLEPLLVRPKGKKFEIVAGERRHRAAKLADLATVPCRVMELTDTEAHEARLVENLSRKDLTPLEEAAGFRDLLELHGEKGKARRVDVVEQIATRVGKSTSWVWDTLKLLDLVADGKKLLQAGKMSTEHAKLIARLTPEQQQKTIAEGLFTDERGLDFDEASDESDPYAGKKAVSVRELKAWIANHIRFDVQQAAKAAPLEFQPLAEQVTAAEAQPGRGRKVVAITHQHYVQPDARNQDERTFGPRSWKRADGTKKTTPKEGYSNQFVDSPKCDHSVLGVVVAGPGQGEAFPVCIARDKCEVHWGAQIKAKARQKKTDSKAVAARKEDKAEQRYREQQQAKEERWKVLGPALKNAMMEKLDALSNKLPKPVFARLLQSLDLPGNTKPENLALALVAKKVKSEVSNIHWYGCEPRLVVWAKALGVNVKALEPPKEKKVAKADTKAKAAAA